MKKWFNTFMEDVNHLIQTWKKITRPVHDTLPEAMTFAEKQPDIGKGKHGLVIQHFFKMGNNPALINGIAVKS
jgi:hypothetical protein